MEQTRHGWYMPGIPVLGRLRQEECKFKATLDYRMRPYFKEQKEDEWTDRREGMKQKRIKLVFTFNNFVL